MNQKLTRRQLLKGTGIFAAGVAANALLAACQPAAPQAPAATPAATGAEPTAAEAVTNALGVALPADALPLEEQYALLPLGQVGGGYGHIMESLYNRAFEHAGGAETLTTLDKNFNVVGIGAESWESAEDGTYWDFNLRQELVFSDGTPITAQDWVYTLRWSLSHGYDFAWYYFDVKNAQKVSAGELPPEELGIEAVDDYTLRIYTEAPVPYLPSVFVWFEVAKNGIWEDAGENWALDPERYVSSGPFTLTVFERDVRHKWELNTSYQGVRRPYFIEIREENLPEGLPAYITGDLQTYSLSAETPAAEQKLVETNPVLKSESHPGLPLSTDYIGFNTTGKFEGLDNPDVRLALCKAIDKENLVSEIFQGFSYPAWGVLPTGFPNNNEEELKKLDPNVYDPEAAQELLANAGYANGDGFPTYEIWIRQPNNKQLAFCEAVQARWKENLGINVELRPADFQSFTGNLKEDEPIYFVNYAADYFDPATFLNVFRSTGRHPHSDPSWDEFYNDANSTFDLEKRAQLLQEAEKRLVQSTAWYFVHHPFSIQLWPCNLQGQGVEPNDDGFVFYSGQGAGAPGMPHAFEGVYWGDPSCREGIS